MPSDTPLRVPSLHTTAEQWIAHVAESTARARARLEDAGATEPDVISGALHAARIAAKVLREEYSYAPNDAERAALAAVKQGLGDLPSASGPLFAGGSLQ